jgi:hypothetical protein
MGAKASIGSSSRAVATFKADKQAMLILLLF